MEGRVRGERREKSKSKKEGRREGKVREEEEDKGGMKEWRRGVGIDNVHTSQFVLVIS